jgi:hypothetical protein
MHCNAWAFDPDRCLNCGVRTAMIPLVSTPTRIAMWSGPRNISTAMMRAWGSRADTLVCDEPLYAHYLLATGKDHPGAAEVIARHETDWRKVVSWLTGTIPQEGKAIFYQKHMAHHLLPGIDRGWLSKLTHGFLIRDPAEMLASLIHQIPEPTLRDTGLPQQAEIFDLVRRQTGRVPPVIDSRDVLQNPRGMLERLCAALEVPFDEAMLSWPTGPRGTDGVWARHWYASVEKSTTFEPYRPKTEPLPKRLAGLHRQCVELYAKLSEHRLEI